MADELKMFLVGDTDEDGDQRENFIAATTHQEAFELWRICNEIDPASVSPDAQVWVYPVPALPDSPRAVDWPHKSSEIFPLNLMNLTSMAVRREAGIVEELTISTE